MPVSRSALAYSAVATVLFAIGTTPAPAQPANEKTTTPAPAPSSVTAAGVTIHSVSITLPDSDRVFPGGAQADAINNNCTACHSVGMVLTQPPLTKASWEDEVNKMRNIYKAPIAAEDVPAIVTYLVNTKGAQ
jgi:cytochrome c5